MPNKFFFSHPVFPYWFIRVNEIAVQWHFCSSNFFLCRAFQWIHSYHHSTNEPQSPSLGRNNVSYQPTILRYSWGLTVSLYFQRGCTFQVGWLVIKPSKFMTSTSLFSEWNSHRIAAITFEDLKNQVVIKRIPKHPLHRGDLTCHHNRFHNLTHTLYMSPCGVKRNLNLQKCFPFPVCEQAETNAGLLCTSKNVWTTLNHHLVTDWPMIHID